DRRILEDLGVVRRRGRRRVWHGAEQVAKNHSATRGNRTDADAPRITSVRMRHVPGLLTWVLQPSRAITLRPPPTADYAVGGMPGVFRNDESWPRKRVPAGPARRPALIRPSDCSRRRKGVVRWAVSSQDNGHRWLSR